MRKWLPHPMLSLLVLVLWFALNDGAPAALLTGAVLALLLPRYTQRFGSDRPVVLRPVKALPLLGILLLDLRDPFVATLLGAMVTLTPGTVAIDVDRDNWILRVHALDVADHAALAHTIKTRYEARLQEIFSC